MFSECSQRKSSAMFKPLQSDGFPADAQGKWKLELAEFDGYKFYKDRSTQSRGNRWLCVERGCRVKMYEKHLEVNKVNGTHNHDPLECLDHEQSSSPEQLVSQDRPSETQDHEEQPRPNIHFEPIVLVKPLNMGDYRSMNNEDALPELTISLRPNLRTYFNRGRCQSLNRMHVMEGECEKSSEMVAESASDLVSSDLKLSKEELPAEPPEPEVPALPEPAVKSPEQVTDAELLTLNGEVKDEKSDTTVSESAVKAVPVERDIVENGKEEERTKAANEEKENTKETVKEVPLEVKEGGSASVSGACSEEEDRNSVTSSQSRKRVAVTEREAEVEGEGSSSESDGGVGKRARLEADDGEDERERLVREYVEECTENMEDMSRAADKLQREIGALGELLRAKELEWNSILRLRKLKEEMLERLLRRRRLSAIISGKEEFAMENNNFNKNGKLTNNINNNSNNYLPPTSTSNGTGNGGLMMVPIVSSSPGPGSGLVTGSFNRGPRPQPPDPHHRFRMQRPILPKPPSEHNSIVGEGRQGAILDVKSIIADYRSRHPENVPRRGRRMRPGGESGGRPMDPQPPVVSSTRISGSPALMSMANMALGSGSSVRENPGAPPYLGQESSRPSSADSSRGGGHHLDLLTGPTPSFKDALVQFAKMSQLPLMPTKPPPPPPPYPEVTLHPVSAPHSPPPPPPPQQQHSLLHGILTKATQPAMSAAATQPHRATTFSPTLARLLTAPERTPASVPHSNTHFRHPAHTVNSRVNINEILSSSKKNRNEITITPVSGSNKNKDDVVLLGDDDEEGDGDRLVIDESRDGATGELPETVPECQGCHQRAAQFVCAGCGNQWYCSRECQVTAWEEHSEMCSG